MNPKVPKAPWSKKKGIFRPRGLKRTRPAAAKSRKSPSVNKTTKYEVDAGGVLTINVGKSRGRWVQMPNNNVRFVESR